jgi:drug/metabolite transporter (DMT)-like permease
MLVFAGVALALTTSVLYACAIGLQALEARAAPAEDHLRVSLLRRLVRRPRWILGTLLALAGWAAQVGALLLIPLTLVEPALATSLVFLLLIARVLGERAGRRELLGVTSVVVGIALLAWAAPARDTTHATGAGLAAAIAVLAALSLLPYAASIAWRPPSALTAAGAGFAYALDGLATKFFSDDVATAAWLGLLFWGIAMAVAAAGGTLSEMSALQRRAATQVAPIVLALTTLVPVALAPVLANETWSGSAWLRAALAGSILLIVAGAVVLASAPALDAVLARASGKGTARSDSLDSSVETVSTVRMAEGSEASSSARTTTSPA